jgi:hypothetical protein
MIKNTHPCRLPDLQAGEKIVKAGRASETSRDLLNFQVFHKSNFAQDGQ